MIVVTQRWQAARSLLATKPLPFSQLRTVLLLAALAGTTVLVMYLAAREAGNWLLREEATQMHPHLSLYASALEGQIEHYRALPAVLALDPDLHTALTGGLNSERQKRLN
ncbi:MAG: cytochrome biosis protein CcmE, partial [Gammaproteobacteria bacterium]|nr:cytochrome biosis protein CcmE [Gammaproteobacteria bacterium]